ncbi:MAG: DoxX family protein [Chloroflexi bacterium]|nr:MAG: DoxX family protein [Chloroflexota bacterium]
MDNTLLWGLQALLALILFPAAATRALSYEFAKKRMAWVAAVPRSLLLFISVAEILGAIGLVLPGLTHVAPQLIPVAAVGLGLIQVLAFVFHTSRPSRPRALRGSAWLARVRRRRMMDRQRRGTAR